LKKTVIWQISLPDQSGPVSFLFGTFHVRDRRAFNRLQQARHLMDQCKCVATEFDLGEIDHAALSALTQIQEDRYLDDLLRPSAWKKLLRHCRESLGLEAEDIRKMHPLILYNMLSLTHTQTDSELAVDEQIYQYAKEKGLDITGVEKFEDQLAVLRNVSLDVQVKQLTHLAKHFSRHRKKIKKMLHWYAEGNISRLYQAARKDSKGMRKILLYDRNRIMSDRIAQLTAHQACFIAIGAGHLAGEKGVLRLLKKKGLVIKPVMPD
jgi:uncharacterized protein YbaP (TraB family)